MRQQQYQKIILIDFDPICRSHCRDALAIINTEIFEAGNEREAFSLLEQFEFSLLLMSSKIETQLQLEFISSTRIKNQNIDSILLYHGTKKGFDVEVWRMGFVDIVRMPAEKEYLVKVIEDLLRKQAEQYETIQSRALLPIYQLGEKFLSVQNETSVFNELIEIIDRVIDGGSISIMTVDGESGELKIVASKGVSAKVKETARVKPGERVAGWVFDRGEAVVLNRETQHSSPLAAVLERSDIQASISFPLISGGQTFGVVNISQNYSKVRYSQVEIELLTIICRQAVAAYENVKSIKEREKSVRTKTLFQQYVSPEIAEILLRKQQNLLQVGALEQLTVLFADIRNFTLLVQQIKPDLLREFLNRFFDLFADIVFLHRGTLDKFMGDAALVYFGSPVSIQNPNKVAVSAAVEIVKRFEELRCLWADKFSCFHEIGLGIGMSRGEMFLGNVGSSRRFDYTVIGTDVNIAQRLASVAASGQILLTSKVHEDVKGDFEWIEEPKRKLRSVEKELKLFSVKIDSYNETRKTC